MRRTVRNLLLALLTLVPWHPATPFTPTPAVAEWFEYECAGTILGYDSKLSLYVYKNEPGVFCRLEVELPLANLSEPYRPAAIAANAFRLASAAKTPEERQKLLWTAFDPLQGALASVLNTERFAGAGGAGLMERYKDMYVYLVSCADAALMDKDFDRGGMPEGIALSCKKTGKNSDLIQVALAFQNVAVELHFPLA